MQFDMVLLVGLMAYGLGSVLGGVLYSRRLGADIRERDLPGGSGTYRQYGLWAAVGVAGFDMFKGAAAIAIAHALAPEATWVATLGVVLGHCYPIFHGLRGGGGIAPLIGALALAAPKMLLPTLALALLCIPLYKATLQKIIKLNAIPFVAALAVPVGLYLGARYGGWQDMLAGGGAMLVRAIHMLLTPKREALS